MTQEDLQKNNEHLVALLTSAFQTSLQKLEDKMDSGFQTLSEEVIGLKVQVQGMDVRLGNVENRLGKVEDRLDGIDVRLDGIDGRLENLESDMTQVKHGVTALLEDSERHDSDIASLKKSVASPFSA